MEGKIEGILTDNSGHERVFDTHRKIVKWPECWCEQVGPNPYNYKLNNELQHLITDLT